VRSWPSPDVPTIDGRDDETPIRVNDSSAHALAEIGTGHDEVLMYVCGITPYDATHLGHAATYLLFDELQRVCLDAGKRVRYVQNVTDVDDPLLERAVLTGEDWTAIAERETQLFREDMTALRVIAPEAYVGAVEAIPDVVESIVALHDRGEVSRFPLSEMVRLSGERGGDPERPGKKDPLDCLLWQAARPGEPAWDSILGHGRPGWHIECAAIALKHLGHSIDVQGGGDDLVFPHHELSAAEAEVITGTHPFARAFVHQAMVGYDGEKMSKSRGNLVLVSKLRSAGVDPMAIRLALLAHSHNAAWEWHNEEIDAASARLTAWRSAFARSSAAAADVLIGAMRAALRGGLDTPAALRAVDAWVGTEGDDVTGPNLASTAVDALLGVV
jgi:L-cysteine:1D-myo-inositol 2-amino-2-deoxy-alpha-D-glucopyranoside ligase